MNSDPRRSSPMTFERGVLSAQKEVVRKFYKDMWDHADTRLIPEIFHEDFTFRGSLGPVLVGHHQFADYVAWITTCLDQYTSDIHEMIEEGNRVSGRLYFHGIHRAPMFGLAATGKHVGWHGAPIFTFDGSLVCDLWVLGDVYGLVRSIRDDAFGNAEFATGATNGGHRVPSRNSN